MSTLAGCIRELHNSEQNKFVAAIGLLTDGVAQQLIKKFVAGPIWANDVTATDCTKDEALFRLYALEDIGIVFSKIENKNGKRYERRFYLSDIGKKLLNI